MKWWRLRRPDLSLTMPVAKGKIGVKFIRICVVVSAIVSVMFVKVFNYAGN